MLRIFGRILCFCRGHVLEERTLYEGNRPLVYVKRGVCPRCGKLVFEMYDLRDDEPNLR
jgi:ribosomal protein S27AE